MSNQSERISESFNIEGSPESALVQRLLRANVICDDTESFLNLSREIACSVPYISDGKWTKYILPMKEALTGAKPDIPAHDLSGFRAKYDLTDADLEHPVSTICELPNSKEQKIIDQLIREDVIEDSVKGFLSLSKRIALNTRGIGAGKYDTIVRLKNDICERIRRKYKTLELHEIEPYLIKEICNFANGLNTRDQFILVNRFGMLSAPATLEEIGKEFGVTREYIRLLQNDIITQFRWEMSFSPEAVWTAINQRPLQALAKDMPTLYSFFHNNKCFKFFVESLCGEPGMLFDVNAGLFESYFQDSPQPVYRDDLIQVLRKEYEMLEAEANAVIEELLNVDAIRQAGSSCRIFPRNLTLKHALIHILQSCPDGLTRKQLVRLMDKCEYSEKMAGDRIDTHLNRILGSHAWLSGKSGSESVYKHISAIDPKWIAEDKVKEICELAHIFVNSNDDSSCHLSELHSKVFPQMDYYVLRQLIREYGVEYGLVWEGKSQQDAFRLRNANDAPYNARTRIVNLLKENNGGLSVQEIAVRMRMRTKGHATLILGRLMKTGRIARIAPSIYVHRNELDKLIGKRSLEKIEKATEEIVSKAAGYNKCVEVDYLRQQINRNLDLDLNKTIYLSLFQIFEEGAKWKRNQSCFGLENVPYRSVMNAIEELCTFGDDLETCSCKVSSRLLTSESYMTRTYMRWKNEKIA